MNLQLKKYSQYTEIYHLSAVPPIGNDAKSTDIRQERSVYRTPAC